MHEEMQEKNKARERCIPMAFYTDKRCVLDMDLLVSAEAADGEYQHDGIYAIHAIFALGRKFRDAYYTYPNKEDRDAALAALADAVEVEQKLMEGECGDWSDEEEEA